MQCFLYFYRTKLEFADEQEAKNKGKNDQSISTNFSHHFCIDVGKIKG